MHLHDTQWDDTSILVIVADDLSRRAFKRVLEDHGHRGQFAATLEDVTATAVSQDVRLFVIDRPDITTLEAKELADSLQTLHPQTRTIVVHDPHDRWHVTNEDQDGTRFLARPFTMLEFIAMVDHALAVQR